MGITKDRNFWESAALNNRTFIQYYNRLTELSISMFEWHNLPDSIDERFLELTLFCDGKAVFFYDEVMGYLCLQVAIDSQWNVYRIPIKRRAYATNGYQRQLDISDSVLIYNNMLRTNSKLDVEMFARRLYNIDRIIDVNVNAQKTPYMILANENQRLSMVNLYKKLDGNEPYIFADKTMELENIRVLNTDAPFISDKLYTLKTEIWNEALTYLGISNVNVVKKERLVRDEVQRNLGGVIASRYSRLTARQEACKLINKMFGLDIWVDYKETMGFGDSSSDYDPDVAGETVLE